MALSIRKPGPPRCGLFVPKLWLAVLLKMATKASYVSNFQGFTRKAARHRIYDYPHIKFYRSCVRAVSFSSLPSSQCSSSSPSERRTVTVARRSRRKAKFLTLPPPTQPPRRQFVKQERTDSPDCPQVHNVVAVPFLTARFLLLLPYRKLIIGVPEIRP